MRRHLINSASKCVADRRGKGCKNIRRLALIAEDGLEDIENAEIAFLKVPVTSVRYWSGHVQTLASQLKRPPFAVVTEISVVPDPKTQFAVKFRVAGQIDDPDVIQALIARHEAVADQIAFPYSKNADRPEPAKPAARGPAKFAPRAAAPRRR
jgi:hypothetical protein